MNPGHSTTRIEGDLITEPGSARTYGHINRLPLSVLGMVALLSVCFLVGGIRLAGGTPLWMDEVLAVWVVRLHSFREVLSALSRGSEFAPPTYHLLLHWISGIAGTSYRVLRLPSLSAGLISGLCVFALLRRYIKASSAAFGLAFTLLGLLGGFALQIRPYALVVACFAVAMLLWDGLEHRRPNLLKVVSIGALLALATALHFYAALLVLCFGTMEAIWSLLNRQLRASMWLNLLVSGASSLLWLPLIRTLSRYNAGDSSSAAYYAKPSLAKLVAAYVSLFISDKRLILFLLVVIVLSGIWYSLRGTGWEGMTVGSEDIRREANLFTIAFSTIAFPLFVFLFAEFVTKTFNVRYCLIACLGFAILAAYMLDHVSGLSAVMNLALLSACALVFLSPPPQLGEAVPAILELFSSAKNDYPIVIGEGLQYFQIEEAAPPNLKQRIYFVTSPLGAKNFDPTNENQAKRWKVIRPDLNIVDAESFFAQHPRFYLLHTAATADLLTDWLLRRSLLSTPVAFADDAWLVEAEAPKTIDKQPPPTLR